MRKFVVAIFVACAVLVATAPSHSHDLEAAQDDDDMNIMMSAFIKGQRGLIAEMKVATLMVANTVMPGFNFDVTVNTSIAHPNTNASCPHPPAAFPLFIETQFQTWIQMLHNIVAGVSYVGAMVGASMVNDEMIKTFMQSRSLLLPYPDVNGGSGFGMGFQVLCGWTQVFSFGGGGGGGAGAMCVFCSFNVLTCFPWPRLCSDARCPCEPWFDSTLCVGACRSSGFGGGGGAGMETPVDVSDACTVL